MGSSRILQSILNALQGARWWYSLDSRTVIERASETSLDISEHLGSINTLEGTDKGILSFLHVILLL